MMSKEQQRTTPKVDPSDFEAYLKIVREFTQDVLRPNEYRLEQDNGIPEEIVQKIRDMGLFGISIPKKYGGLGLSMEQQVLLTFEFTQASAVYRSRFSTTIGLCSQSLLDYGTEEQKSIYLPEMASGNMTAAFALSEPDAGSDAGSLTTEATKDGDHYIINGTKRYITNAPEADVFVVMARTDPEIKGSAGVSAFIVEAENPGIKVGEIPKMLGQTGSHVTEVYFKDCKVPASTLMGGVEGMGLKAALRGINSARTHVAATCVGQAIRILEEAFNYARKRVQFKRPIAEFQSIQNMLADCRAEIYAAKCMTLDAARRFCKGEIPVIDICSAKYFSSEMVTRVADRAVQIFGGAGFMEKNDIARLYRDVRLFRIFEGTSQIQQYNIARQMLKSGKLSI